MHRIITGAETKTHVDHWDGQTLNNQKQNLRVCTCAQNIANSRLSKNNTTGFKGVARFRDKWRAYIGSKDCGTWKHLGHFDTPEAAAEAYDKEAKNRYGQFALTNQELRFMN